MLNFKITTIQKKERSQMTNIRNFTIAVFSASLLSGVAVAQDAAPEIPGSETTIELENAAERDAVAAMPADGMDSPVANPVNETTVPGSEAQIELNRAAERGAVAEGVDGGTIAPADTVADVLVPGSGATFSPGTAPVTQSGEALQDESPSTIQ
ncbi:MAG TPA: hypothetical protein VGO17_07995 [Aurantimonas sp.]|nr:hypothetical protein [Aurantimonas sp.]